MMIEYKVLSSNCIIGLQVGVKKYLAAGWELAGGVCFTSHSSEDTFLQAITCVIPNEDPYENE